MKNRDKKMKKNSSKLLNPREFVPKLICFEYFSKDCRLPIQLQRAMAAEAEAAREARAKVRFWLFFSRPPWFFHSQSSSRCNLGSIPVSKRDPIFCFAKTKSGLQRVWRHINEAILSARF